MEFLSGWVFYIIKFDVILPAVFWTPSGKAPRPVRERRIYEKSGFLEGLESLKQHKYRTDLISACFLVDARPGPALDVN